MEGSLWTSSESRVDIPLTPFGHERTNVLHDIGTLEATREARRFPGGVPPDDIVERHDVALVIRDMLVRFDK
jgi:hypothetical protein